MKLYKVLYGTRILTSAILAAYIDEAVAEQKMSKLSLQKVQLGT